MLRVDADPAAVTAATGFRLPGDFLLTSLSLDGWPAVQPVLVHNAQGTFFVVRDIERGYVATRGLPDRIRPVFYQPYWHVEAIGRPRSEPPTFVAALQKLASGSADVAVDSGLALAHLRALAGAFRVHLPAGPPGEPGYRAYAVRRGDVLERFARGRPEAVQAAAGLARALGAEGRLEALLDREDDPRFALLDRLLEEAGLAAVLAAAPVDVQELTGTSYTHAAEGVLAFYRRGSDEILILAPEHVPAQDHWYASPVALPRLWEESGRLGIQDAFLTVGLAGSLGLLGREYPSAVDLLRRWREARTDFDLPWYLIAAQATRSGVEGSLEWARDELAAGRRVREADLERAYLVRTRQFLDDLGPGLRFQPYWTSIHAGTRSLTPAPATDQPIGPEIGCLRWDCGILLFDGAGLLRAVTDIARNLVFSPAVERLRDQLDRILVEELIPACRTGVSGEAIYLRAVQAVEPLLPRFREAGLLPPFDGAFADVFTRDVGHVLGKQEPVTLAFARGHAAQRLRAGTVAAVEWQWFAAHYPLACEDLLVVTDQGGVNLMRPAG